MYGDDTLQEDCSSRVLIDEEDISLISDSFECKGKFRLVGAPWYCRLAHFVGSLTQQMLWHPRNCRAYRKLDALRWIRTYLSHCLRLVQQIANLRHARTEFERMKTDLVQDRTVLGNELEATKSQLQTLHADYQAATESGDPTYTLSSDANLLLGDFRRYRDLYSLYNDIINLIGKTLADSSRIEKLAFLCGTVRKSDIFANDGYKCFEDTLYKLLGQVAECDRTKEYINSQLSVAKNSNLDAVLSFGVQSSRDFNDNLTEVFLRSGKICLEAPGTSSLREESQKPMQCDDSRPELCPALAV